MKKKDKFFLVVLATVFLIRLFLFFMPTESMFYNDYYHHVYFGILLVLIFSFVNYELHKKFFYIFAVAIGLIVDEIVYLIPFFIDLVSKEGYFSIYSLVLMLVGLILVYMLRGLLVKEVNDTRGK